MVGPVNNKFSVASVSTEPDRSAHSFILTGKPGIGKTYFVSTIDRVFIVPIEEGLKGASPEHRPAHFTAVPKNLAELEQAIDAFGQINAPVDGRRPYAHVALDSLSGIESLIHDQACADEGVRHMEGRDYGKVFAAALPLFVRVQKKLDAIRRTGVHVWLIAHAQETADATEDGDIFRRWDLAFRGSGTKAQEVRNLWRQWADHVLFIDWDTSVRSQKGKRTVGKLRARILRCRESGYAFAKTRARIPDNLPATWEDLRNAMAAGTPASEGKLRQQIDEAIAKMADANNVALIQADVAKAKSANRLAAILSRAQGFLAVERSALADLPPAETPDTMAAEPAQDVDEPAREPAREPVRVAVAPQPVSAAPLDDLSAPDEVFREPGDDTDQIEREMQTEAMRLCNAIAHASDRNALNDIVPLVKQANLPPTLEAQVRDAYAERARALRGSL